MKPTPPCPPKAKPAKAVKARTPKQIVMSKYPLAFGEWVPGWGLWRIANCGARNTTGFSAREAWFNAGLVAPRDGKKGAK